MPKIGTSDTKLMDKSANMQTNPFKPIAENRSHNPGSDLKKLRLRFGNKAPSLPYRYSS